MSEYEYINDSLYDNHVNDMYNDDYNEYAEEYTEDFNTVSLYRYTRDKEMHLDTDLPKCAFEGNTVLLRRRVLKHYKCEGIWYDGVVCKILKITRKAILFQIDRDEYYDIDPTLPTELKFWIPRMALRWHPSAKSVISIKHWIDLEIYKIYNK